MKVNVCNKINTIYHKRGGGIFFSLALATLFAMAVFTACNPIWNYSGVDSACFIVMGRGILAGKVPYVDLIDNKGMVLYFLNALPQLFSIRTQGAFSTIYIWGLELAFLFLSLRTIAWISRRLGVRHDYIPQIFYLLSIVSLVESGNLGEEYSNLFILIAFAVSLQYVSEQKAQISWKYGVSLGILFCLAFFIRPNNALPIAAIVIVFAVGLLMQKNITGFVKCSAAFLAGALIVCVPIFMYLHLNHAVMKAIQDTILVNLLYEKDSGQTILQLLKSGFGFKLISFCGIATVGIYTGFRYKGYSFRMKIYLAAIAISAAFAAYSALISRFAYSHYLLSLAPPTAVAIAVLCSQIQSCRLSVEGPGLEGSRVEQSKRFFSMEAMWVVLSISLVLSFSGPSIKTFSGNLSSFEGNLKSYMTDPGTRHSAMLGLAEHIPEDEKSSVYILDGGTTNASDLYVQMGLLPCKKLFVAVDRFCRLIPGMEEEYKLYLKKDAPKWIITASELDTVSYPLEFDEINRTYKLVTSNDYGIYLYQRKY